MRTFTNTPATLFHADFPEILLRLHSRRIPPDRSRVRVREMHTPAEIGRLFCAFRATRRQIFVPSGTPFSRPLRLAELAARLGEIPPHKRERFEPGRYLEQGIPDPLEVPAYALGGDQYLLLDGNHRTTAAYLAGVPFTLRLKVLDAPVDRRFLFDLRYWDGGFARFLRRLR